MMPPERLSALLDAYFDEVLSEAEAVELSAELAASPESRREFWARAAIHGLLPNAVEMHEWRTSIAGGEARPRQDSRGAGVKVLALAAGLCLAAVVARQLWRHPPPPAIAVQSHIANAAFLARTVDVVWADPAEARSPGALLQPGWLKIKSGVLELQFLTGARVILEGPAEFEILSEKLGKCHRGKLTCHVPPEGRGFRIQAPGCRILDYGTDFAVKALEGRDPEVHVLSGKVAIALDQDATDGRELTTNEAVRVTPQGLTPVPAVPADFVRSADFSARAKADAIQRFAKWKAASDELARDPDTLVYYTFEDADHSTGIIQNMAARVEPQANATVIGCDWTDGRWPNKNALEFRRPEDHVLLIAPRVCEALTYLMWARLDSLPHYLNALIVTEDPKRWSQTGPQFKDDAGFKTQRGGTGIMDVHWQIQGTGELMFDFDPVGRQAGVPWDGLHSPPVIRANRLGQWICLACVYDSRRGTISHYLDGELVAERSTPDARPISLGHMEIGNWSAKPDEQTPDRALNGKIDEVAVISRAFNADEIRRFYDDGCPTKVR